MSEHAYDLVVIGAGPGGYVAAIRASQLGLKVACVEKEAQLGGTCLRVGCIPSKALLQSSEKFHEAKEEFAQHGITAKVSLDLEKMMARKDKVVGGLTDGVAHLFRKNGVTHYSGHGRILNTTSVVVEKGRKKQVLETRDILIATGSKVARLPGVDFDGDRIGDSTTALSYPSVPKHLVIIGAGVIGLELGSVWSRLGARVTVLEYMDRILPGMDADVASAAKTVFKKQGLNFELGVRVTGAKVSKNRCLVEHDGGKPIACDRVLVAVGRVPNTDKLGLESVGVSLDPKGRIPVGPDFQTSAPHIYAIGDVIAGPMLAHKAEEEGIACVERIVTGHGHINYESIPNIVYTHPEIASVGRTEEELKQAGVEFKRGKFPFMANGRARAMGSTEGFVKILAHAETDRILGAHIIGPNAGDLIAEIAVAIEFSASAEDIARSCHAHPTLSEVVKEAAMNIEGRAIHM